MLYRHAGYCPLLREKMMHTNLRFTISTGKFFAIITTGGIMVALTQSEILDELVNLGITSVAELEAYIREYSRYFALRFDNESTERSY
jgi:hypothetical protein